MKQKIKTIGLAMGILVGGIGLGLAFDTFAPKTVRVSNYGMAAGDTYKCQIEFSTWTYTACSFTIPTGQGITSANVRGAMRFSFQ